MSVTVSDLTKIYGTQRAIDSISFNIHKGEIVGFLGPNGAGKSTTMKIITGYIPADEGRVEIDGIPVNDVPVSTKMKVGYLPEANPLYHDMYVKEYLHFISNVHNIQHKQQAIEHVIETVGLRPESGKKIGQLSKGYKQRVGLAAAMIHNPEVLILDEPTSGLDPNQIQEIREVIKSLGKNKTIMFSTHILQEVQAMCDRVIIINKGRIVADDSVSNLQKRIKGDQAVIIQFKESVDISLFSHLKEVTGIEELDTTNYKLQTTNPDALRKQVLQLSLQNNLNIVSLQNESNSLEEIFRTLTTQTEQRNNN